jgi:hypothetical protein
VLAIQQFLPLSTGFWYQAKDADPRAKNLFDRHYSKYHYVDGRNPPQFVGPGEKMVLMTCACDALFVWRKFISADGQQGVNCSVFRNEGCILSSLLITEACSLAWARWPGERLFTYVNPRKIRSTNPGFCFLRAGWRRCGITKRRKLIILEKLPERVIDSDLSPS